MRKSEFMQHMSLGFSQCKNVFKWSRRVATLHR